MSAKSPQFRCLILFVAAILFSLAAGLSAACSSPSTNTPTSVPAPTSVPKTTSDSVPSPLPTQLAPMATPTPGQTQPTQETRQTALEVEPPTSTFTPPTTPPTPVPTLFPTSSPLPTVLPTFPPPRPLSITLPTITSPTFAPPPRPTIPFPTITFPAIAPTTTLTVRVEHAGVAEFAATCGDLMEVEIGPSTDEFTLWALSLSDVEPPHVLVDFWDARVGKYLFQIEVQGDELVPVGPNARTHEASDDEVWVVYLMDPELRDALVRGGCLTDLDVQLAGIQVAARERLLDGRGQGEDVSVIEFALACADMKVTVPTFDALEAVPAHLACWWEQLNPPPELTGYYDAVAALYDAWIQQGVDDPADVDVSVLLALSEAVKAMDPDDLETLTTLGCSG